MDDKYQSLGELASYHGESIVSQLVHIGNSGNQQAHAKFRSLIEDLECLQLVDDRQLRRESINAFKNNKYVALSYTWSPSRYEGGESGQYHVDCWDDDRTEPSQVRNCVLDRVIGYMRYTGVKRLWIDRHCIRQDTCDTTCTRHNRCIQKSDAIQAMDLVYQISRHPVALLGRPLQTESELDIFESLLSRRLFDNLRPRSLRETNIREAREALSLLHEITQDLWWSRAWTFQENYRGGAKMRLLIRHHPSLEQKKLNYQRYGRIPGELLVKSIDFSKEATQLCLALRNTAKVTQEDISKITHVLKAAGRYTDMLEDSSAMTPRVIADIEARKLSEPWDRPAIIANCCQYSVRLDNKALIQQDHSLGLSVLAMCLLNGEILDNNNNGSEPVGPLKVSEFLEKYLFKGFSAPKDDIRKLTFNKGCRLTGVKLRLDGIWTIGHLWELGPIVDTAKFPRALPYIDDPRGRLELNQRKALLQLSDYLDHLESPLAQYIEEYLADDARARAMDDFTSFTEMYLHCMASELATAILERRKLILGSIWYKTGDRESYSAVFVWPNKRYRPPAFAFTSMWPRDPGSNVHDANDIDHHVSLEVKKVYTVNNTSHLRVRSWLPGMCFFSGYPCTKVVFPWPRALQAVKP